MATPKWTVVDIPPQDGKCAVVTGANRGLGYHTTLELARKRACVIMACRSLERARAARDEIIRTLPGANLEIMRLDLADLASIGAFVETYRQQYQHLHLLINNAGLMNVPRRETADGFELQLGTNHLGHFALTGLLLDLLVKTPQSRVVTVSSMAHRWGAIRFRDLMGDRWYFGWGAYGQSKLANLLFAYELQRRLAKAGMPTISVAAHPGYTDTNLSFVGPKMRGSSFRSFVMQVVNWGFAQSVEIGVLPQLYAATMPQVQGGSIIGPNGLFEMRGYPKILRSSAKSYDEAVAKRLWAVSEQLTGVVYDTLKL